MERHPGSPNSELPAPPSELCQAVVDSLPDGVYVVDAGRRIVEWNAAAEAITGHLRHDVLGRHCFDGLLTHSTLDGGGLCQNGCPLEATLIDGCPREIHCYLRHKDGHPVAVRVRVSALKRGGEIAGAVQVFEQRAPGRRTAPDGGLEGPESLDPLTGLPNHALIETRLGERVHEFPVDGVPFGLLLADVDNLKGINRTYGRDAGNSMLRTVALALLGGVTEQQLLGRWEKDKFLVVIDGCDPATLRRVGERLRALVAKSSIQWWGAPVHATVSIGGVIVRQGEDQQAVIARAGKQLALARAAGGNTLVVE